MWVWLIVNVEKRWRIKGRAMTKKTDWQASDLASHRLILLSPRLGSPRSSLVELSKQSDMVCYIALQVAENSLEALLAQAVQSLHEQLPGLESRLERVLRAGEGHPQKLAEALQADLAGRVRRLVLDGFDLLLADDRLAVFMACLADGDPAQLQILVHSRFIDRAWWRPLVGAGKALALGADEAWASGPKRLEVYAFRRGAVFVDGRPISRWEGPLVRDLFFFLVDHPLVTRDEIFDTFWPSLRT